MKVRLFLLLSLAACMPVAANAEVSISVSIAPPPLPVYVQPVIPAPGYIWTPGYWRWNPDEDDYYWIPGTWILPPTIGLLWTPGYWGWDGAYVWHTGYWGPRVGFYGGINYGCGYVGSGYQGGYWRGGVFNYNRSVNNINTTIVRNVYNTRVVENNTRVSFNGGQGGIAARPSVQERQALGLRHVAPTSVQLQHERAALKMPDQRASFNQGAPRLAALPRPASVPRPASAQAQGTQAQGSLQAPMARTRPVPVPVPAAAGAHGLPPTRPETSRIEPAMPQPQNPRVERHAVEPGGQPVPRPSQRPQAVYGQQQRVEQSHVEQSRGQPQQPRVEQPHIEQSRGQPHQAEPHNRPRDGGDADKPPR